MIIKVKYKILKKKLQKLSEFWKLYKDWCSEFDSTVRKNIKVIR